MKYFIIDFDSTFVKTEGLEELANVVLNNNPRKDKILKKIKNITNLGMEGKISFNNSLSKRIQLIDATKKHVQQVAKTFKNKVSRSFIRNKKFFKTYKNSIYIVSGGFKEFVIPIALSFKIDADHIFANTFNYDKKGNILGVDNKNFLANENGKFKAVKSLRLKGDVYVIGDGYTDYEIKKLGAAKYFIAFTENVTRKSVLSKADYIASNLDEFLHQHIPSLFY